MNATVHFDAITFSLQTTDASNTIVTTIVNLLADDVPMEYVMGALTAGASRRTNWQNGVKSKANRDKPIPTEITMKWGEWIDKQTTAKVQVVTKTRDLTPDEIIAQALADPDFLAKYQAAKAAEKKAA